MTATLETPLLRDADFRNFYAASAVSQFGSQITYVALPLLAVTTLHAGPAEVGLLSSLTTITVLVVGLPAGAWLDRVRRRPVMVGADLARALLLASLPLAWWQGWLSMWQLYGVAMATGIGTLFFDVASHSALPHIVGRERLTAANSMLVGTTAAMDVSGRSFAGVLVGLVGAPPAVLADVASYLASAVLLRRLRRPEPDPAPSASGERLGAQIAEGVRFMARHPVLRPIAEQGALHNLGYVLMAVLLPVLVVRQLGYPEWVLGVFLAVGGVGMLAGSATAHLVGTWLGRGRAVWVVSLTTMPAAPAVPLLDRGAGMWVAALGWFVLTYRAGLNNVLLISFRQRVTPDAMLGRMNATMRLLFMGAVGVGGLLGGLIGELWGVRAALWAGAAVCALSWLPIWRSPIRSDV
ncbi:MFS transporter [Thermoactinospora rubra]|uniref:MFS transporter n=1 Tax=Thermoactinospora rubra TaxID=1088767 RepID=UPI000A11DEFE|nr:MFS transporter [Thermoactinospora rubra]